VSNAIPVLAERTASGDRVGLRKALMLCLKVNLAVVVPVVLFGCLGSRYILAGYGKGFSDHSMAMDVALITGGLMALQIPIGQIVIASGRMWLLTGMQIIWAAIFCGGTWAFLSLGALGLILARLLAYIVHTVITTVVAWQSLKGASPAHPSGPSDTGDIANPATEAPERI
jgi:O-antigen/teichoic acid export membrane protein